MSDEKIIVDDAALWKQSRESEIQEYEVPEDDFLSIGANDNNFSEPEPEEERITKTDIQQNKNRIEFNEPTAGVIVGIMDVVIPLLFVFVFKTENKDQFKLDSSEKDLLLDSWANYLATTNFSMSPGTVLITSLLSVYAAKVTVAVIEKKEKKKDKDNDKKESRT